MFCATASERKGVPLKTKYALKKSSALLRLVSALGVVASVAAIVISSVTGLLAYRLYRYLTTAQKALPVLEQAARLYIAQHPDPVQHPETKKKIG